MAYSRRRPSTTATIAISFLMAALVSGCVADTYTVKNRGYDVSKVRRFAVLPLACTDPNLGANLADALGTELLAMGFDLVERVHIEKVLREQRFQLSGMVTPEQAKQVGKLAGVDALLTGRVTPFTGSPYVWGGEGQIMMANIRFVDTETGQVIFSTNYKNGEVNASFQRFDVSVREIARSISEAIKS